MTAQAEARRATGVQHITTILPPVYDSWSSSNNNSRTRKTEVVVEASWRAQVLRADQVWAQEEALKWTMGGRGWQSERCPAQIAERAPRRFGGGTMWGITSAMPVVSFFFHDLFRSLSFVMALWRLFCVLSLSFVVGSWGPPPSVCWPSNDKLRFIHLLDVSHGPSGLAHGILSDIGTTSPVVSYQISGSVFFVHPLFSLPHSRRSAILWDLPIIFFELLISSWFSTCLVS